MKDVSFFDRRSWGAVREAKGIPHQAIADELGLYVGSVQKWFSGERQPTIRHAVALAQILGIPLSTCIASISDPDVRAILRSAL